MNALQLEYEKDFYSWIYKNIDLLKQRKFSEIDVDILIDALKLAIKETKLSSKMFPKECPYSMEQLLDENFYPHIP